MPKQARSRLTYQRILRAAEEAFTHHGYESVSVSTLCRLAGVSKGAFYHHFPSKQAVFLAVLQNWLTRLEQGLRQALEQAPDLYHAREAMIRIATQALDDARGRLPLFLAFWQRAAHDPDIWPAVVAPFARFEALLTDYLQRAADRAICPQEPDPARTAQALVAFASGVLLNAALRDDGVDHGAILTHGVQRLLSLSTARARQGTAGNRPGTTGDQRSYP